MPSLFLPSFRLTLSFALTFQLISIRLLVWRCSLALLLLCHFRFVPKNKPLFFALSLCVYYCYCLKKWARFICCCCCFFLFKITLKLLLWLFCKFPTCIGLRAREETRNPFNWTQNDDADDEEEESSVKKNASFVERVLLKLRSIDKVRVSMWQKMQITNQNKISINERIRCCCCF